MEERWSGQAWFMCLEYSCAGCLLPCYQATGRAVCAELAGRFVNRNFSRLNKGIFALSL